MIVMTLYEGIGRDGQHLAEMMYAPAYTKLCLTAIELEVFSYLTTAKTAAVLAKELGWHAENTGFFLDALVGIKLLCKDGEAYQNRDISNKHLVRGGQQYMGDFMKMYTGLGGFEQTDFATLVHEGPQAAKEEVVENFSFADQFAMMRSGQSGERTYEAVATISSVPEFATAKKLLDLGCGTGMLGIAAAKANPALYAVLFDMPAMEPGIKESIEQSGLQDRVTAMGGDYLSEEIGSGYDMIIAFATLNFAKPVLGDVMDKLYTALNPGGVLIVSSDGIHSGGTLPGEMVVGWLHFTMKGMDFRMPSGLIPKTALAAGFRNVQTMTVPTCSGASELNIIRK